MKTSPHFQFETPLWEKGFLVAGIDEVGRGSFAGPLVVCAVVLKPILTKQDEKYLLSFGVNDSKLVNPKKRKMIKELLQEYILFSTVQYISCDIINDIGIGKANKVGFSKVAQTCIETLSDKEVLFLTDAFKIEDVISEKQKNIIRGDATSFSIAAASILAKLERDAFMERLGLEFPAYGFDVHKGYGTKKHREMIKEHGACPAHRTEFVKNWI